MPDFPLHFVCFCSWLLLAGHAGAAEVWQPLPYVPDADTLHLWHLDEAAPPFADAIAPPTPLRGLLNGARAGQASLAGFGTAVSFNHVVGGRPGQRDLRGALLLAAPELAAGPQDDVSAPFAFTGPDGAFTYEALIKLDVLPASAPGLSMTILSMDGDGDERVFHWRIEEGDYLTFIPINSIETAGGAMARIPATGPDAINTRDWFHVAVSYNGREGLGNNVKLYWTRVRPGLREANLIGEGTMPVDLLPLRGDFAIGNEARDKGTREAAPFPGLIDEVRLSGVARSSVDFLLVPPEGRIPKAAPAALPPAGAEIGLEVLGLTVDGVPVPRSRLGGPLELESGLHRLDFDFQTVPPDLSAAPSVRWQLAGMDPKWEEQGQGMALRVEALNAAGEVVSQAVFPALGSSRGWETAADDSAFNQRREPILLPEGARSLRVTMDSGAPDTTGQFVIDDLDITCRTGGGAQASLWSNSTFSEGGKMDALLGTPKDWTRTGSDPSIARVHLRGLVNKGLSLVDGSQALDAAWTARAVLPSGLTPDTVAVIGWEEAYNVIGGKVRRASYQNVPPGSYRFRAIATTADGADTAELAVPILIKAPFWTRPWYWALVGTLAAALVATAVISWHRRRNRLRLRALRLQNALAEDRARIARDMHDDLGTRLSVLTLHGAMAERHLDDPERSRSYLVRMNAAARNLVAAMDDLVWSVNPANDTLIQFGTFLARTAKEVFQDSPVRWQLDFPPEWPDVPLRSEVRHHLALAIKEICHNILRHAGPCEARLTLRCGNGRLEIEIADTGCGFDPAIPPEGNGLGNIKRRLRDIGGELDITAGPGAGTTVRLSCAY